MKTIKLKELLEDRTHRDEVTQVLERGGLVCLPVNGKYRILADLENGDAVIRLFQSKRRVRKAPALVFVGDRGHLEQLTDELDPLAAQLIDAMWPGPLTLLVSTSRNLPRKITRQIAGGKANKVGVRVPETGWLIELLSEFGRPVLVSSANRERKNGETSPAQIRRNFGRQVDLFVDAGDLVEEASSTVVDVDGGQVKVVRPGAISSEFIQECALAG